MLCSEGVRNVKSVFLVDKKVFRQAVLFVLFFLLGAGFSGHLGCSKPEGQSDKTPGAATRSQSQAPEAIPVVLTPVRYRTFEGNLSVQATLKVKNVAMVSAKMPGTIESIYVEEGDPVSAHETKLFKINSQDLEKVLEVKKKALSLKVKEHRDKEAALELTETQLEKAKVEVCRYKELLANGIVCRRELEQVESRYKRAAADCNCAKSDFRLACAKKHLAQVIKEIAEKDVRDTLVCAPISGRICRRFQKPGEMIRRGTPVLKIEDPTLIEVVAYLPQWYYTLVHPGKTALVLKVNNVTFTDQVVSYKGFSLDPKRNAFKIKSLLKDPPEDVMPGGMAEVVISLPSFKGIGLPSSAIRKRGQEEVVFVFQGIKVHKVPVQTGIKSDGWIQVMSHKIWEDTLIVSKCQFWQKLEEGTPVVMRMEGG